jgi:hypothetical protein
VASHSRAVWSALPVAMVCPSALNATEFTLLPWPVRVATALGVTPIVTSYSRALRSALPVMMVADVGAEVHSRTV